MSKIESLISGSLTKDAELKRSSSGKSYVTMVVKLEAGGEKPLFCRASLFGDDCETVAKLRKGDSVALVGKLEIGVWMASDGATPSVSMLAHRAISPAAKKPKRQAAPKDDTQQYKRAAEFQASGNSDLRDDLPW